MDRDAQPERTRRDLVTVQKARPLSKVSSAGCAAARKTRGLTGWFTTAFDSPLLVMMLVAATMHSGSGSPSCYSRFNSRVVRCRRVRAACLQPTNLAAILAT